MDRECIVRRTNREGLKRAQGSNNKDHIRGALTQLRGCGGEYDRG